MLTQIIPSLLAKQVDVNAENQHMKSKININTKNREILKQMFPVYVNNPRGFEVCVLIMCSSSSSSSSSSMVAVVPC